MLSLNTKITKLIKIGGGSYGNVYSFNNYAVKIIKLNIVDIEDRICTYVTVLKELYVQYMISIFKFKHLIPIIYCELDELSEIKLIMPKFDINLTECMGSRKYNIFLKNNLIFVVKKLVTAIHALHCNLCISHGDIKPSNIFLKFTDTRRSLILSEIVLADYGLALLDPITDIAIIQTRWYRSPSAQILYIGNVRCNMDTRRSDIWAIGCIIYELLIGEVAFQSKKELQHLNYIKDKYTNVIYNLNYYIQNNRELSNNRRLAKIAISMLNDPYINNKLPPNINEIALLLGIVINNKKINTISKYQLLDVTKNIILKWDNKYYEQNLEDIDKELLSIVKLYKYFKPNNIQDIVLYYIFNKNKLPITTMDHILTFV